MALSALSNYMGRTQGAFNMLPEEGVPVQQGVQAGQVSIHFQLFQEWHDPGL